MSSYQDRKAERTLRYQLNHGRKLIACGACSGSGVYDHIGSPPCSACDGTGKEREAAPAPPVPAPHWRDMLKIRQTRENLVRLRRDRASA